MTSPLPSILNFRDVGKTINAFTGKKLMREGRLFRSARPDEATQPDRDALLNTYKIKTIIDLRTKTEHIEQAAKRDEKLRAAASSPGISPLPDSVPAEPLQIPGINYVNLNFNGRAYANALLAKLSWSQYLTVILWMGLGYRRDAIKIIAENVMIKRKLIGLGTDSLDVCTAEIKEFFTVVLASLSGDGGEEGGAVLVHCTQGKDRTGLTILLILLLLHIPFPAAEEDYMLSDRELASEREERISEIEPMGFPAWFAGCDPGFVKAMDEHIREKYGGIEKYLEGVGVDGEMQGRMRKALLA